MRIAYFDLNDSNNFFESYSCFPKRYGGAGTFAKWAKEILNSNGNVFKIIAPKQCFDEVTEIENKSACISIPDLRAFEHVKAGRPIDEIFSGLEHFDLICFHNAGHAINKGKLKIPVVTWNPFGDTGISNPYNDYALCYNQNATQKYPHQPIKYVKIGKTVPKTFSIRSKEDFIFQCTHHCKDFNTIEVAQNCIKYNVTGYFAGPIHDNYDLLSYIDNKNTFYLGEISEQSKLDYTSRARLYTLCLEWDVVFNQSAIEANGLGTPILASKRNWLGTYIKDSVNGFFYDGSNFIECYNRAKDIDQRKCWEAAKQYNIEEMINSFYKAFQEILVEWNNKK